MSARKSRARGSEAAPATETISRNSVKRCDCAEKSGSCSLDPGSRGSIHASASELCSSTAAQVSTIAARSHARSPGRKPGRQDQIHAERLTFTVKMGKTVVIEPSPIVMKLDGYDLSSGVVFNNLERYSIDESYLWYGAHATAVNRCNGAKLSLTHDLSFTPYTFEVRVLNDGVAYRHVIPGEENASRAPDEYSTFVIPDGSRPSSQDDTRTSLVLGRGPIHAVFLRDSPTDDAKLEIEKSTHKRSDSLTIELRAGGGFLARFAKSQ